MNSRALRGAGSTVRGFVAAAGTAVTVSACSLYPLPEGATEQAQPARAMWILFGWTGFGVAALVIGLILWCVIRYRARAGDVTFPTQMRRNGKLEIIYTILPLILVTVLFAYTYRAERTIEAIAPQPQVVVDVTGFRWSWRFAYPQFGIVTSGVPAQPPELVLPLGQTVRLNVTSVDVDHSFWVPAFLFKRDAIPGLRNVFDWKPTKLGTFRGECGEFCGLDHAFMSFSVRVITPAAFAVWTRARHGTAVSTGSAS